MSQIKSKLSHCLAFLAFLFVFNFGAGTVLANPGAGALAPKRVNALDNDARDRLKRAMREMHRRGLRPRVNSTFRSRAEQQSLYSCTRSRRCRARRGIYGARRPGTTMHEAGLAVDMGGVAAGRRRRLTPKGRETVRIMRKHGFSWPYGLKDPAHFEISARRAGYRSEHAAIKAGQQRWLKTSRARRRASSRA
jgi:hypothetical protein